MSGKTSLTCWRAKYSETFGEFLLATLVHAASTYMSLSCFVVYLAAIVFKINTANIQQLWVFLESR